MALDSPFIFVHPESWIATAMPAGRGGYSFIVALTALVFTRYPFVSTSVNITVASGSVPAAYKGSTAISAAPLLAGMVTVPPRVL